ncbi:MAG: efflux RND transporter permease subunit [Bacteroidales bacterium]|nr:efflux RND transporter permease subunit [Bacteroidales bacterium]
MLLRRKKIRAIFGVDGLAGLEYRIAYNPTRFVEESIEEVVRTLLEATVLVVLTVFT